MDRYTIQQITTSSKRITSTLSLHRVTQTHDTKDKHTVNRSKADRRTDIREVSSATKHKRHGSDRSTPHKPSQDTQTAISPARESFHSGLVRSRSRSLHFKLLLRFLLVELIDHTLLDDCL